jgi:uncharacterized spore protein YtfJ
MQVIAKTETVIGEPIVAGEVTLIPVSKISIGFAAGGGGHEGKSGSGSGTGGGVTIVPVAFFAIIGNRVEVHPVSKEDPMLQKIFAVAPEVIKKVAKFMGKDKDDGKKKERKDGEEE